MKERKIADKYLTFGESRNLISEETVELLIDTFDKTYEGICNFFNHGELRPVEYIIDPRVQRCCIHQLVKSCA